MIITIDSLPVRRIHDYVVIELAVDNVSSTGDQRKVRESVGSRLRSRAGKRPGAIDLCKYCWVGRLLDRVVLNLVNAEGNVNF